MIYSIIANLGEGVEFFDKSIGVADSIEAAEEIIGKSLGVTGIEYFTVEMREINTTRILAEFYYDRNGEFLDEVVLEQQNNKK